MRKTVFAIFLFATAIFLPDASSTAAAKDLPEYASQKHAGFHIVEIQRGDTLAKLFGEHAMVVARFNRIDPGKLTAGLKIKVPNDLEAVKDYTPMPDFYAPAETEEKYILIDIEEQFLGAYEYGALKFSMPISSAVPVCVGANGRKKTCFTPGGDFKVLALHRDHFSSLYKAASGRGGAPMPFAVMFYVSNGGIAYWLHGGDLPGHPASHGCIRLMREDAKKLFVWSGGNAASGKMSWVKNGLRIKIINADALYGQRNEVRLP